MLVQRPLGNSLRHGGGIVNKERRLSFVYVSSTKKWARRGADAQRGLDSPTTRGDSVGTARLTGLHDHTIQHNLTGDISVLTLILC